MYPSEPLRRTSFFDGRVLTAADLQREQEYFRERLRRHNRALHGWGVVSGLDVVVAPGTTSVTVTPGYALAPQGDEIVVADALSLSLCASGTTWVVAARYDERPVDALPVPAMGVGEPAVQFSTI